MTWLQGTSMYVDLRRRPGTAEAVKALALRELTPGDLRLLTTQDAFAGTLRRAGDAFTWERHIQLHPSHGRADTGTLTGAEGFMVETGLHDDYVEHWVRDAGPTHPSAAISLRERSTGRRALLLRVHNAFGWARDRRRALPPGTRLPDLVERTESLHQAQDLLDCEVSVGTITAEGWQITCSSLPFRETHGLDPLQQPDGTVRTLDIAPDGQAGFRLWDLPDASDGVDALFAPPHHEPVRS